MLLPLALASAVSASLFATGDVFASIGNGKVNVYSQAGVFKQQLDTGLGGFTTGGAFDQAGNFYVTAFSANKVAKFDNNGNLVNSSWASGSSLNESIVFDASGNAYIGNAGAAQIQKVDSSGAPIATYGTQQNTDWIDLAADQKTVMYSNEGNTIRLLDTVTNVDTVFTTGSGPFFAKRFLQNGDVIAASGDGNVYRWNSSGVLQQTYAAGIGSVFALNVDPNGTSFWTGSTGGTTIRKFNIATGALEASWDTGVGTLYGLAVYGEYTAGGGQVPEPGTLVIWSLLGGIGIAVANPRRKSNA
jgi:WD40 repeat protein